MSTVITSLSRYKISNQEMVRAMRYVDDQIITTPNVNSSFNQDTVTHWPERYIKTLLKQGQVDRVIQVGYTTTKCEIVNLAEELGIDVFLIRS